MNWEALGAIAETSSRQSALSLSLIVSGRTDPAEHSAQYAASTYESVLSHFVHRRDESQG